MKPFLFFLGIFFLFHANLRSSNSEDIEALKYLPFSLLREGNLDFNEFSHLYPSYRLVEIQGNYYSTFPIVTALLATPIYAPFIWFGVQATETSVAILSKLTASLFVLGSCVLLFLLLKREGNPYQAVFCYALGSGLWSILAQDLESQTAGLLCHTVILFCLFSSLPQRAFWIGICLGLSLGIRQSNLVPAVVLALILLRLWGIKSLLLLGFGVCCAYLPILWLHFSIYGDILGGYAANHQLWGYRMNPETGDYFSYPLHWGILGLLISPSRGILIYSPWLLFFAIGYFHRWKEGGLRCFLILPILAHFLFYAKFWNWPGGVHYGGRFLLELFPYWVYLMFPAFQRPKITLKIAGGVAFLIHALGAFAYENLGPNSWDITPIHTIHRPARFWEVSDCQIFRTIRQIPHTFKLMGFPTLFERSQRLHEEETQSIRMDCLQIRKHLEQGEWSQAEHRLVHARQWGETEELYELEGELRKRQRRWKEALQAFEKGYRFSQSLACLIEAVQLCRQLRQYETGIYLTEEASKKLTLFYQPFYLLGILLRDSGKYQEAIVAFSQALTLKPGRMEILLELGSALIETKQFSQFKQCCDSAKFSWNESNQNLLRQAMQDPNPVKRILAIAFWQKNATLSQAQEKIKEDALRQCSLELLQWFQKK